MPVKKDEVLRILAEHRDELRARFSLKSMRLFGSVARGEASTASDVDILVDFHETPSLFTFLRLRGYLQDLLGVTVDLVTETGLCEKVKPHIEREAIDVA